jgi:hypothetical protein
VVFGCELVLPHAMHGPADVSVTTGRAASRR